MPIPESQLSTWSGQGSVSQSADTYAIVRRALESGDAPYRDRNFSVFLQGSYGNDTNIYAESDVDIVICYDGVFFHNIDELPQDQQRAFHSAYPSGTYPAVEFRAHVLTALQAAFGEAVQQGTKAIHVVAGGARRSADVVVANQYRRYHRFNSIADAPYQQGICFHRSDNGARIINYPKQHSENCTAKHTAASRRFKPMVRVFKNMRSKLVDDGTIAAKVAPSYYLEGLLYNVPSELFSTSYSDTVLGILKWLHSTKDRSEFVCANELYYLLRDSSYVCWPVADGDRFIRAVIRLWNDW